MARGCEHLDLLRMGSSVYCTIGTQNIIRKWILSDFNFDNSYESPASR
jgi:hypothetical protein